MNKVQIARQLRADGHSCSEIARMINESPFLIAQWVKNENRVSKVRGAAGSPDKPKQENMQRLQDGISVAPKSGAGPSSTI